MASNRHSWARVLIFAFVVTALVALQLFRTAAVTGNYEGAWFSLLHTLLVAIGVVLALG